MGAAWLVPVAWAGVEAVRSALAWRRLRAEAGERAGRLHRPRAVAVLQPIRGGDPSLAESLAANLAELGALGVELHWLLDDDDPLGAEAVREARARVPGSVRVRTHAACPPGINPKLDKLEAAWRDTQAEILVFLDDDARLPGKSLAELVAALEGTEGTPVVSTALPAYLAGNGLGSRLLAAFVNDHATLTYLPLLGIRPALTLNGMAWAIRRDALEALGGLAPLRRHLTDDLAVARAVLERGGRIEQLSVPVWMRTELAGVPAFLRQMHRWLLFASLLFGLQSASTRLVLALAVGLPALLPPLALAACLLAPDAATLWSAALAWLFQSSLRRLLEADRTGREAPRTPLASLAVALILPALTLWALLDRDIRWRDRRYRVRANDRFEPA